MKKKIKDITIGDMIEVCNNNKNKPCFDCPLIRLCAEIPYNIKCNEDLDKELDLCLK